MTEYKTKTNTGSSFRNTKKQSEKSPDYTGTVNIANVEYWVSVWVKKDKNNNDYFSYAFKKKEAKVDTHSQKKANGYVPENNAEIDDSIPF